MKKQTQANLTLMLALTGIGVWYYLKTNGILPGGGNSPLPYTGESGKVYFIRKGGADNSKIVSSYSDGVDVLEFSFYPDRPNLFLRAIGSPDQRTLSLAISDFKLAHPG
jgi:hypothetical protein